jgi:hypothetical protein
MRKVSKDLHRIPTRLTNQKALDSLARILLDRNADKVSGDIYMGIFKAADKRRLEVREMLNTFYFDKCGYCEMHNHPEVEHYRPKGKVTEDPAHPGYYWLCYEWTNLLPSCHDCNAVNGKLNQFPVLGVRVPGPSLLPNGALDAAYSAAHKTLLQAERPYLLHPEIDNPTLYLGFEIDAGGVGIKIIGIDGEGRGEKTIGICDLNRNYVKLNRLEILDPSIKALNTGFYLYEQGFLDDPGFKEYLRIQFSQISSDATDVEKTHTLLRWFAFSSVENFEKLILPDIAANARAVVLESFKYFQGIP